MYGYSLSTDTSVQLHSHTSLSIRPDQPCDTGESQLLTGSSPSEQPPTSCHQSSQGTDHPGSACSWVELPARNKGIQVSGTLPIMLKQLVKTCMYIAYTCFSVHVLVCIYMYIHCTWVPHIVCIYHCCICHCMFACAVFGIGIYYAIIQKSTIVYKQGRTSYIPLRMAVKTPG
jgi:hypothetical protein